jgi:hypothetical protein
LKLGSRYRIIGVEVLGLGAFLLLIMLLQLVESGWNSSVEEFAWVYAIIGITLVLVGLETLSLNRQLPAQ